MKKTKPAEPEFGKITSVAQLGELMRAVRKSQKLTLEKVSGLTNISMRFLSELERGKETAEIGKVLKALRTLGLEVIVQPRSGTPLYSTTIKKETQND